MTTITEIICEKCLRPMIPPESRIASKGFAITKCKHLYHLSCIRDLYNTPTSPNSEEPRTFICQNQNCAATVKNDNIFTIVPTLQSRTIDSADSTMPDENLKRDLKIAQDTINELRKMARQNSNDLTRAQNRIVELETKLADSNALYRKAIEVKTCQLVHQQQHSSQTDGQFTTNTNVILPATLEIPKPKIITKQKNIQTIDLTDDEPSEPQAQIYANAQLPMEVDQMPKTIASQIPPLMELNQSYTNYNAPSQTTTYGASLRISNIPATSINKESDAKLDLESDRQNPASIITRSYSPAKRFLKRHGPTEQTRPSHLRFQKRFKMDSEILKPFYPLDSYPLQYTAAGIHYRGEVPKIAILAKDILMIGDGLIYGMVQFISRAIPFEFNLHPGLYRRDLSIVGLVSTLFSIPKLPPRIMLSIGNWDAFNCIRKETFYGNFQKLLRIFRRCRVEELYLMPPIRYAYTQDSSDAFAKINSVLQTDWGDSFEGKCMLMNPEPFFENVQPVLDEFGPMFEIERFEPYVLYIRDEMILSALAENTSDDEVIWM